jgi:hypothetical protein
LLTFHDAMGKFEDSLHSLTEEESRSVEVFMGSLEPEWYARRELVRWLAHPVELGGAPEQVELWDRRTLFWPPTGDRRELFLFRYKHGRSRGVGLVGSVTCSMRGAGAPSPDATPEDALAAHCLNELAAHGDPRANGGLDAVKKLMGL